MFLNLGKEIGRLGAGRFINHANLSSKMAKKLYVGNLNYDTNEGSLQKAFEQAGTVESCTIIENNKTGRSKGFGFVEMSSEEEAKKAIEMFNGSELDGRTLKVDEARPRK